jgi:hypothetical protein
MAKKTTVESSKQEVARVDTRLVRDFDASDRVGNLPRFLMPVNDEYDEASFAEMLENKFPHTWKCLGDFPDLPPLPPTGIVPGCRHPRSRFSECVVPMFMAIESGNTLNNACRLVGVDSVAVTDWRVLAVGREEVLPEYVWFGVSVAYLRGVNESMMADQIKQTALSGRANTWQAAAWWLERTNPKDWGKKDNLEVSTEAGKPLVQVNQVILKDDEAFNESRRLLDRIGAARTIESIGTGDSSEPAEDIEAA